jgi:hypothetical protein
MHRIRLLNESTEIGAERFLESLSVEQRAVFEEPLRLALRDALPYHAEGLAIARSVIALGLNGNQVPCHSAHRKKTAECVARITAAALCPLDELGHIYAPIGRFAVIDPALRFLHALTQFPLCQLALFTQGTEKTGQASVSRRMLRFGSHWLDFRVMAS